MKFTNINKTITSLGLGFGLGLAYFINNKFLQ